MVFILEEDKKTHLEKIHKALLFVANKLNSLNIKWLLGASGALMVHGIDIIPKDIDILTTSENIKIIIKEFKPFIVNLNENDLQLKVNGIEIEIIKLNNLGSPKSISFRGASISVNTLKNELFYYKQRPGKEEVVKLIEEKLSTQPQSLPTTIKA